MTLHLILGYDPYADPIPTFDEVSLRCWLGPSSMACNSSGKWGERPGAPDNAYLNRCPWFANRKIDRCTLDLDDPPTVIQEPLFRMSA